MSAAESMSAPEPVLSIRGLSLEFPTYRGRVQALGDVSIEVAPGEIVAVVGESGSGKSVTAMACMRLLPAALHRITSGTIAVLGRDVSTLTPRMLSRMRGKQVSMVFQEPMSALNPTLRIGRQIIEVLRRHDSMSARAARARAAQLLAEMQVPDPKRVLRGYAFELSGGMRQRVLIAMAFACNPQLLIADEPTTALDVTVQAQVLGLIRERARAQRTAVLFISHDVAVVSQLCSRIYVMYAGQIVEHGSTLEVLEDPLHPYTRALLGSLPDSSEPGRPLTAIPGLVPSLIGPPAGCRFRERCDLATERCAEAPSLDTAASRSAACWYPGKRPGPAEPRAPWAVPGAARTAAADAPLLRFESVHVRHPLGMNWRGRPAFTVHAVNGVDLEVMRGETLAVVGESGCGKTTLAELAMRLLTPTSGSVMFDGADLGTLEARELRRMRRRFQMVFQDPQASLDPRMRAWQLIAEPLAVAEKLGPSSLRKRAEELALLVGIPIEQLERHAHEFSGGQRQRLAIARALALEPDLLILDEPTSALDVSVQAQILNLLMELQARRRLTYLFISHNVAVVRHVATRVAVMYLGQIVELGPCALVIDSPQHPYTRQLFGAVPRLHQELGIPSKAPGAARSNLQLPAGCHFLPRCGWVRGDCYAAQNLRRVIDGRQVRCHRAESIAAESP